MSGEHGENRLRIEVWEMELAKRIAGTFRRGDDDLTAALLKCVAEVARRRIEIRNWQAFLAQSLYNAAKNFIRHEDVRRRHIGPLEFGYQLPEERPSWLEERLIAPEEPIELRLDLARVWEALTPEMQELWQILSEEEGNITSVAQRLRRPRKTVEYHVRKLRRFLETHDLG